MKIAIIGYHHLAEGFLGASESFKKLDYNVNFFPLLSYNNEDIDKDIIEEHLINFINGVKTNYLSNAIFNEVKVDVVLWWNFSIDISTMLKIKENTNCIHIAYSWDDPYRLENKTLNPIYKHIDISFTCCGKSIDYYKMSGCKEVHYLPPGFDKNIHHPDFENKFQKEYECDISIVCTNLYDFDDGLHINRRKMLDEIVKCEDIKFHLYGPEKFRILYPDNYKGYIDFNDSYKVFNHSRININTHVRKNGKMYVNERTCQILGSRGLLYIDGINDIESVFNIHTECVIINENNYIEQIRDILHNYDLYETVKTNGYNKSLKHYTWDIFAFTINQHLLDYIKRHDLEINYENNLNDIKVEVLHISKDNLLEVYDLLCSIYYSNYSIQNKLNILNMLIKKYDIDINLFLELNLDKIVKQKLKTILL